MNSSPPGVERPLGPMGFTHRHPTPANHVSIFADALDLLRLKIEWIRTGEDLRSFFSRGRAIGAEGSLYLRKIPSARFEVVLGAFCFQMLVLAFKDDMPMNLGIARFRVVGDAVGGKLHAGVAQLDVSLGKKQVAFFALPVSPDLQHGSGG